MFEAKFINNKSDRLDKRFNETNAIAGSMPVNLEKLSSMLELVVAKEDRRVLWNKVSFKNGDIIVTLTPLLILVIAYCRSDYTCEIERDAAYLKCLNNIVPLSNDEARFAFQGYAQVPLGQIFINRRVVKSN